MCSQIATILRGKNKPTYTPHVDCGDYVIVVNAEKVAVTGNKRKEKLYKRHTGYPGGLRETTMEDMLKKLREAEKLEMERIQREQEEVGFLKVDFEFKRKRADRICYKE